MKAMITFGDRGDPDRFSKLGLRLISEGVHDVALMELLEERYPGISRNAEVRHSMLDLTVPLQSHDDLPSGGSMCIDSDVRCLPRQTMVITDVYRGQSAVRRPVVVVNDTSPGPWSVYMVNVNGREYRPEWAASIEDIVPGAKISVCVAYMGDDPAGALFGCVIREGEVHNKAKREFKIAEADGSSQGSGSPLAELIGDFYTSFRSDQMVALRQLFDTPQKIALMEIVLLIKSGEIGSPLALLIGDFYPSVRPDQMGVLMQLFDTPQKIMCMEIVRLVRASKIVADKP